MSDQIVIALVIALCTTLVSVLLALIAYIGKGMVDATKEVKEEVCGMREEFHDYKENQEGRMARLESGGEATAREITSIRRRMDGVA